jgi:hypothetical protein
MTSTKFEIKLKLNSPVINFDLLVRRKFNYDVIQRRHTHQNLRMIDFIVFTLASVSVERQA